MRDQTKATRVKGLFLWLILLVFIFSIPFIPLALNQKVEVSFLSQQGNDKALVFFGFTACKNVCPMTMAKLRQLIDLQKNPALWPQVFFIDIDETSNAAQAAEFAEQFHPSFKALHIESDELKKMSALFGLNIKQEKDQLTHMGKTYLLQRKSQQWHLVKIYNPNNFSVQTLQQELFDFSDSSPVPNNL